MRSSLKGKQGLTSVGKSIALCRGVNVQDERHIGECFFYERDELESQGETT